VLETAIGPLGKHGKRTEIEFRFPAKVGELESLFLLCQYKRE
jgi:hypothetical protein